MEGTPYIFQGITRFLIQGVEKFHPKSKEIKKLAMEVAAKIPPGKYCLVLTRPFPPLGRPGRDMDELVSLNAEDIESVWVFPKKDEDTWYRVEIRDESPARQSS